MLLRSNIEWQQWGQEDPLYGVTLRPNKQKGSQTAWTDEEIYALGASNWRDFFEQWRQYGVASESCLEIGCGVGRITRQLAQAFHRVSAVDVSEGMIAYAKARVGADNVEFDCVDGLHLPQADCSVTAIFSAHVLQQLDMVGLGYEYFREFFRVLDVGGSLMIQLPVYEWPSRGLFSHILIWLYHFRQFAGNMNANLRRRLGLKTRRATPYPISGLCGVLQKIGFQSVEFRIFPVKSDGTLHSFVLARK